MQDMLDGEIETGDDSAALATAPAPQRSEEDRPPEDIRRLVQRLQKSIRADKKYHEKAFDRMRRDMFVATHGRDPAWNNDNYKANIAGRHVRMKTNALYAKNPQFVARRKQRIEYKIWNGDQQQLLLAMQQIQQAAVMQAQPPAVDEMGMPVQPALPPGFAEAQALIADFQQGYAREQQLKKFGQTLEVLMDNAAKEQNPLDLKTAMKQLVRRACTTGVGYVEIDFQREMGPANETVAKLNDARTRLAHLQRLQEDADEGDITELDAEMAELALSLEALMQEPEIVLREGLVYDYPASTKVIPDRVCKSLVGFVGANHLTIERTYTVDEVREIFGVDVTGAFTPYTEAGRRGDGVNRDMAEADDGQGELPLDAKSQASKEQFVCVWKYYDKPSGLVYWLADGHDAPLRPPAPPAVFVPDFWPVYALTFNAVESENELFPPSDVTLLLDQQREINRSRQGQREHREAARPRWVYARGAVDEADLPQLKSAKPFDAVGLNIAPGQKVADIFDAIKVPGVDPNLYETNQFFTDMQLTVGTSPARLGGLAKATATESAIAESSASEDDQSGIDDLDAFLTAVARASSQILMREMTPEQVVRICGPGAVWPGLMDETGMAPAFPALSDLDIINEVWLEIQAGSSGKPNQAIEIRNWKEMLPFLLQMGSIPPTWLARETIRRLDDRIDLNEAVVAGIPAIVAMNRAAGGAGGPPGTGDAQTDPAQQGDKGGDKAPPPGGPTGSGPAFGSNQV
jgi:hypothetical protein